MKIIEERQFDYIPNKVFKNLSKRDRDNLRSYRLTYRWYKNNDDKLKSLEKEITKIKEKKEKYVKKLIKKNKELDHLRKDYQFSWSVSRLKNKGDYYNFTISRRQYNTKTGSLGSSKNIKEQLYNCLFYKNDKDKSESECVCSSGSCGGLGGGPHRAEPDHVQRQTGVRSRWRSTTFWRSMPLPWRTWWWPT